MSDQDVPDLSALYGEFISENKEILERLTNDLVTLENSPKDLEIINKLFRSAHTLKGNAGFVGLDDLSEIAHKIEHILDKLREEELAFFSEINDVFFKAIDISSAILDDFIAGKEEKRDISNISREIESLLQGPATSLQKEEEIHGEIEAERAETEGPASYVRDSSFMRVSTQRLDTIVNLVGELATGRSRLLEISSKLKIEGLTEIASYMNNVSARLQDEVLSIRMVPIKELFNRFYRLVRETSRTLGKDVRLVVKGEETELDKSITELLYDPLVHLIRNSVGHGIENDRERAGKNQAGTITMNAFHEHNNIHIQISDDGAGLNIDKIKEKAIERGIVTPEDAETMLEDEIARLIFASGFSTAGEVDSVSGRGVGMDVVKSNIERIGGDVKLEWEEGVGTTVTIRAPLTLAIVQLFLVRQGNQLFGIPLPYVDETIIVREKDLEHMKGQLVHMLRHKAIPILRLSETFELKESEKKETEDLLNVIILDHLNMRGGLIVDEFMGKVETVIKPLGPFIDKLPEAIAGISGASILGSGEVVLVVDVPAVWEML